MAEPAKHDFTLDDFRNQLDQLDKMGGLPASLRGTSHEDPKETLQRIRRMIDAMSEEERRDPDCIDVSQRQRIAAESGTNPEQVEQFLQQFAKVRELMRQMAQMSVWQRLK